MEKRPSFRHVILIAAIALAVRAVFLPFVLHIPLAGDERYYWHTCPDKVGIEYYSIVTQAPLWGMVLWWLRSASSLLQLPIAGRALSALIGASTPLLVYLLATTVFDRRTGLIAGILYSLFPEHIGFSHCLWAEILLSFLAVLAVCLFFKFVENPRSARWLYWSAIAGGFALITKEYILFLFVGFLGAFPAVRHYLSVKKLIIACCLFIFPATVYSVAISCALQRIVFISEGIEHSMAYSEGLVSLRKADSVEFRWRTIWRSLHRRPVNKTARFFDKQVCNLWTPNSYPIVRLIHPRGYPRFFRDWTYGPATRASFVLAWMTALSSVAVITVGLTGLCLGDWGPFRNFSFIALGGITLSGFVIWEMSRYRLPFMFILIIWAAYVLTHLRGVAAALSRRGRVAILCVLLLLYAHVVFSRVHTLGYISAPDRIK
jgi:4-amino-4-deoxy-L-arabinose transferase-like glycosyltransferase